MQTKIQIRPWLKRLMPITLALVLLACGPDVSDSQMVQTAKSYLEQNKLREASLELKNALQENPVNAEARYLLGTINLDLGDAASAEKEFRRAADVGWQQGQARVGQARALINSQAFLKVIDGIDIKESYSVKTRADLYALRALAQAGLENINQAITTLDKAAAIDADAFHVQKSAIEISLANNDMEAATVNLKKALAKYPDNQEILLLSAMVNLRNKNLASAAQAYTKIIQQNPENLLTIYGRRARLGLARLQISNKELANAQVTLLPLFKHNTADPETNFLGGRLAFELGELGLAEERFLIVLRASPNHAPSQLLFGAVSYAQQDYERAAYYIARYLSVMPDNLGARKLLARTYLKLGRTEEAQTILQPGLQASVDDTELLALLGLSQLQAGDTASGIAGLEKAVTSAPENSTLRRELARAYISAGETARAIKQLNAILAAERDKISAKTLLISAHLTAEHYDKAITVVLDMLQKNPDDAAVLALAGNVFVVSNDRPAARKYLNRALLLKPDYVPANMLLARLEESEGHPARAEVIYKKLLAKNPQDVAPLMALANLAETHNQIEKMLTWLEQAREAAPNDIKPHKILAEYYLGEKQLEQADVLIKQAVKIAPHDKTLLVLLARLQLAQGQNNNALSTLNTLVTRMPDSLFVRTMLGEVYLKLEQATDARTQLELVLAKQPYYLPALVLTTNLELGSGSYAKALTFAETIQKIKPDLYLGYELAGDVAMMTKDYPAATGSYQQAAQQKSSVELTIKLSESAAHAGKFELATKPLLAWLDKYPDEPRVLQFLGVNYQNMNSDNNAMAAYEKVLSLQPDNEVALNNLAWLYSLTNNPKSLELAERAYQANPRDVGIQDTYAWVLVQQGQTDKGRRLLEQAIKAQPEVAEIQYHYAIALLKSDKQAEARQRLRTLLDSGKLFEGREAAEQIMR